MRTACTLLAATLLAGCSSNWQAYGIDTSCEDQLWFTDGDQDGWGSASDPGTPACEGSEGTVRNNRDCDDGDASVTGRTGVLCPTQLVAQDTETEFAASTSGSEFVAVHADTELVWAAAAAQACGPYGWGGQLATFRDVNQLNTVLGTVEQGVYGAWVGYAIHGSTESPQRGWGTYDADGEFVAETDGGSFQVELCNCVDGDPDTCADVYGPDLRYMALVKDTAADNGWCLGTPDDALTGANGEPAYQRLYGHFICERTIPDPQEWQVAIPEDGTADDTDTEAR